MARTKAAGMPCAFKTSQRKLRSTRPKASKRGRKALVYLWSFRENLRNIMNVYAQGLDGCSAVFLIRQIPLTPHIKHSDYWKSMVNNETSAFHADNYIVAVCRQLSVERTCLSPTFR